MVPSKHLHDIKEHIKNILTELPQQLNKTKELQIFATVKSAVTGSKERLRGCDYRLWEVMLAMQMANNARITVCQLLNSLAELSQVCYAPTDKRTPRSILRFYNVTFIQVTAFLKLFSIRKCFGLYWHSLITHAPFVRWNISFSAVNTEEEWYLAI